MALYKAYVSDGTVHTWDSDGEGDFVMLKHGFTIGIYETPQEATKRISDFFDSVVFSDDRARGTSIEDESGDRCEDGTFIVDYTIYLQKIENVCFPDL